MPTVANYQTTQPIAVGPDTIVTVTPASGASATVQLVTSPPSAGVLRPL